MARFAGRSWIAADIIHPGLVKRHEQQGEKAELTERGVRACEPASFPDTIKRDPVIGGFATE